MPEGASPNAESGPAEEPAKPSNLDSYLEVKATPERATLSIKASHQLEKIVLSSKLLLDFLAGQKITNGLKLDDLERMITEKMFDRGIIVAEAIPPENGQDARIEEMVKIDADTKPVELAGGKVDFRNVDNIHTIQKGGLIARKLLATEGIPGCDVYGKPILAKPGRDVPLKPGKGVVLSEDGLTLTAERGGYLYRQAGAICLGEGYVVKGDVDFKTGNIHYHGDVQIDGSVKDGFSVEADGDLAIAGSVEGCEIKSHEGTLIIGQAVFGHGRAKLESGGDMTLPAVQDATLECGGKLHVVKDLRNCTVHAALGLEAETTGCHVVGGEMEFGGETIIARAGSEGGVVHIHLARPEWAKAHTELAGLKERIESAERLRSALEGKIKQSKAMSERLRGHMPERMMADFKATLQRYVEIGKTLKALEEQRLALVEILRKPPEPTLSLCIKEKIEGPIRLRIEGQVIELHEADGTGRWFLSEDGIAKVPGG